MELSVQDWLVVIGALLIVGVLLDAFRRYRNERRNPIRMRKSRFGMGGGFGAEPSEPAADVVSAELPAGGARVVEVRQRGDAEASTIAAAPSAPRERREPRFDGDDASPAAAEAGGRRADPAGSDGRIPLARLLAERLEANGSGAASNGGGAAPEMVVLHVLARDAAGFNGSDLLKVLRACDVRFGAMNIFHRHEEEKGQGAVQFSIANATEPGSFDIDSFNSYQTPGLSFFMRLPGPKKPLEAFDCMLETARVIVKNLDGEMRDASNSAFTAQTGEHCRQRIREFVQRPRR